MSVHATLETSRNSDNQREAQRLRMSLEVPGSLDQGESATFVVHNLSASGILIGTPSNLVIGQNISIELPEAEAVSATVVWQSPPLFGCRFDHPLARASLSAAQLRNPLPPAFDPFLPALTYPTGGPLSERLRSIRQELGMSRAALSAQTGLSKPSIWAWETGKTAPRRTNLSLLAKAFGMSEAELLNGNGAFESTPQDESPLPYDLFGASSTNTQTLCQTVDAAKAAIAALAGVDLNNVKIIVEF